MVDKLQGLVLEEMVLEAIRLLCMVAMVELVLVVVEQQEGSEEQEEEAPHRRSLAAAAALPLPLGDLPTSTPRPRAATKTP